jgi:putative endonuclease
MLASQRNGTLYIGVTSNLVKRVWEHKSNVVEGFTKMYKVHNLAWYEIHDTIESAIQREKALKKWRRKWKIGMIESFNPEWTDLYESIIPLSIYCMASFLTGFPLKACGDDDVRTYGMTVLKTCGKRAACPWGMTKFLLIQRGLVNEGRK